MPRTSKTWPKGSGIPARGSGGDRPRRPPFSRDNQPPAAAKSAGWAVAAEIRERIAERRHELLDAQFSRALDTQHPQGHQAATDLLNRIVPPVERHEVHNTGVVIVAPEEAADPEAWAEKHAPKPPAAG